MVKLAKLFGKNKNKILNILLILAVVWVFLKYNSDKSIISDNMSNNPFASASSVEGGMQIAVEELSAGKVGAAPLSTADGNQFLNVNGLSSGKKPNNSCSNQPMMDPKELLPSDKNNEWSNIMPNNDLKDVQMLNAGHHIGINTVGSSLNANLQIRSEPVIPQNNVGPWNNTTIEPDNLRRPLKVEVTSKLIFK